jgi:protein-serine/threonine kinase
MMSLILFLLHKRYPFLVSLFSVALSGVIYVLWKRIEKTRGYQKQIQQLIVKNNELEAKLISVEVDKEISQTLANDTKTQLEAHIHSLQKSIHSYQIETENLTTKNQLLEIQLENKEKRTTEFENRDIRHKEIVKKLQQKVSKNKDQEMELDYLRDVSDRMLGYLERDRMAPFNNKKNVLDYELENADPNTMYKNVNLLTEGGCANILSAVSIKKNQKVAIKEITLDAQKITQYNISVGFWKMRIRTEIATLKKYAHPNIVSVYGAYYNPATDCIWIAMELMDCCLTEILDIYESSHFRLSEPVISRITTEVLKALIFLHSNNVIHRDIKSDNILINSRGAVKLTDFGMSCQLGENEERKSPPEIMGTIYWLAPEILRMQFFGCKGDIWALGIMCREMITGLPPYIEKEEHPTYKWPVLALVSQGPPLLEEPKKWSSSFKDFMDKCFIEDYDNRPTAAGLYEHSFCKLRCEENEFAMIMKKVTEMLARKKKSSESQKETSG